MSESNVLPVDFGRSVTVPAEERELTVEERMQELANTRAQLQMQFEIQCPLGVGVECCTLGPARVMWEDGNEEIQHRHGGFLIRMYVKGPDGAPMSRDYMADVLEGEHPGLTLSRALRAAAKRLEHYIYSISGRA